MPSLLAPHLDLPLGLFAGHVEDRSPETPE